MPRFPSAQGRLNHEPGFHLSCDENLSKGWGPPLLDRILHHATTISIRGDSYRLKDKLKSGVVKPTTAGA